MVGHVKLIIYCGNVLGVGMVGPFWYFFQFIYGREERELKFFIMFEGMDHRHVEYLPHYLVGWYKLYDGYIGQVLVVINSIHDSKLDQEMV